ncbi:MAG: carboxypeptidase-like regulatory domain-containing protein, partial [Vicinamibacterales bacterium]
MKRRLRSIRWCAVVVGLVLATAHSAFAQLTTGSLAGIVKDAQGGVIPGATLTLVSETRGTRSVPVVTNATGDFVFPNLPADTYTIEVEMSGFKILKQSGITVNPGPQVSIGALTLEVGGGMETVNVKGESPLI